MPESALELLAAHDRAIRRGRPDEAFDCKMRHALSRRSARGGRLARMGRTARMVAGLAVAVGLGAALVASGGPGRSSPAALPESDSMDLPEPEMTRRVVVPPTCRKQHGEQALELSGRCRQAVGDRGIVVQTWTRALVEPSPHGLVVHSGLVLVEVEEVPSGEPPVQVNVGGGVIEVLGTRFVIYQGAAGGEVELLEGAIRFSSPGRPQVNLAPGDRTSWSPPAATGTTKDPARPPPATKRRTATRRVGPKAPIPEPPPTVSQTLERVADLRAAGRYGDALREIRALTRTAILTRRQAEVLSFEEGSLLEPTAPRHVACGHWKRHAERFPRGSYAREVARHLERLGCSAGNPAAPDASLGG